MSSAEELADRVREEIGVLPGIAEIRMFGGLCFTLHGNMLVGIMKGGDLLARVDPATSEADLARPGASLMEMGGRSMKGFLNIDADVLDDATLRDWLSTSMAYVGPMPPKVKKPKATKKR